MSKEEPQPGLSGQGWLDITEDRLRRDHNIHYPLERRRECFGREGLFNFKFIESFSINGYIFPVMGLENSASYINEQRFHIIMLN